MKWYRIPDIEDLNKPFIKKVKIADKSICIVGYNGELFAVSSVCPHQGFDLSSGWCENGKIICPLHGYSFDLQTGKGSEDYLKTYAVKIQDNSVYVGISSVWDDIKKLFNK
jgi:nitrite reductase/ring-hydroxylating ferredoxin subunit